MCCWILFAKILLRIFESIFISDIGLESNYSKFSSPCLQSQLRFFCFVLFKHKEKSKFLSNCFTSLPDLALHMSLVFTLSIYTGMLYWKQFFVYCILLYFDFSHMSISYHPNCFGSLLFWYWYFSPKVLKWPSITALICFPTYFFPLTFR